MGIEPGDEIDFVAAGEGIRVQRRASSAASLAAERRSLARRGRLTLRVTVRLAGAPVNARRLIVRSPRSSAA